MSAQVIPVRTTGTVQTESTNSTAAAHQALVEHNVKQVAASVHFMCRKFFFLFSFCDHTKARWKQAIDKLL